MKIWTIIFFGSCIVAMLVSVCKLYALYQNPFGEFFVSHLIFVLGLVVIAVFARGKMEYELSINNENRK